MFLSFLLLLINKKQRHIPDLPWILKVFSTIYYVIVAYKEIMK